MLEQQLANVMENMVSLSQGSRFYRDLQDEGFLEVVRRVVEMLRAIPNHIDVHALPETQCKYLRGGTSLHLAMRMGYITMVAKILAASIVDFHACDHSYWEVIVLHYALKFGNMDIVKLMFPKHLKSRKKDVMDNRGHMALHWAIRSGPHGNVDIMKLMVVKHLESRKLDVNAVDDEGNTTLHLATIPGWGEQINMVRELLKCKDTMRLSEKYKNGQTPLQIAHEKGDKDV